MIFGNKSFSAPFLTQWVGDDLQNVSYIYGGPTNELNWTFMNERLSNSLWQADDGSTKTLDAWEDGYVVSTNPDGTLTAKPKYTSGLPSLTLRRVQTMSSETEGADTNTPESETSTEAKLWMKVLLKWHPDISKVNHYFVGLVLQDISLEV